MTFDEYSDLEFRSPAAIADVQAQLLTQHVRYCAVKSPFYRRLFAEQNLSPESLTLESLSDFPLTDKACLEAENTGFLAVPDEQVVDIVFSSGTTGRPTSIAYTESDLCRLAYNERQSFLSAGMRSDDTVLLTCTMDRCFVAGLAYFLGARRIGASTIRNGHGTMDGHCEIISRMSPSIIVGVPSFLVKLAHSLREQGVDPERSSVRRLICIGEPVRNRDLAPLPVCQSLYNLWDASVYSTYASSETITTFCECEAERGGHLHPELAVVEVVDEEGRRLPYGQIGEVVVTPMGVEGMPFIRFCTGDLSFLIDEPCSCNRNTVRLGPILARKKQMIKLKGTTLYPQGIALALESIPAVTEHYVEVISEGELSDRVIVYVAVDDEQWPSSRIRERLQSHLRVKPEVQIEPLERIRQRVFSPEYRKPKRFFDGRRQ